MILSLTKNQNFENSIAQEQVPLSSVVLVVEGSLRVFGRDASGQEFTLRRVLPGQWWGGVSALNGLAAAGCRTSADSKILVVPAEVWERWWRDDRRLGEWLVQHSQREDLYSALRSLLVQRELQDLSLPELLDKIQPIYLFSEVLNVEDLNRLVERHPQMSWFPQFPELCFPDLGPPSSRGFNASQLRDALDTSPRGLRLVGIPVVQLQALLEAPKSRPDDDRADPVLVEQPAWQNPDGSELLTLAMQQDQGPLSLNRKNLQVKTVFGSTPVEQGLALLQMVCEVLQLPFRRDVVDRMLNGMVGARTSP